MSGPNLHCPHHPGKIEKTNSHQYCLLDQPFLYLPLANEVCEGYIFTPVCLSFSSQEGSAPVHAGMHSTTPSPQRTRGRHPSGPASGTPRPEADPLEQCMLGDMGNKRAICYWNATCMSKFLYFFTY